MRPYWDQFWKILILKFWLDHKVTINHRGGILIFCQILMKLKNLKFDEIGNFGELRNLDFDKIWKFGIVHQNLIINLERSRRQLSNDTKIMKFGQILVDQIQNSYIANFAGSRLQNSTRPVTKSSMALK